MPLPATPSVIGATGLHDCSAPVYDATCPNVLGSLNGILYTTDYANNLYSIDAASGKATLIGATGMPALPFIPFSGNFRRVAQRVRREPVQHRRQALCELRHGAARRCGPGGEDRTRAV